MQPDQNRDPSQLSPRAARRQFLNRKRREVKESTYRAYKYPTEHFVSYCEANGVQTLGELNAFILDSWVDKRTSEDIADITAKNTVKFVRVFIKWCESIGIVERGTYDSISVPKAEKEASEETVKETTARQVLNTLSTYEYATRKHAAFAFIWEVGCRASGAIAIDVDYVTVNDDNGKPIVKLRDRPKTGTPLKNAEKSERNVMISEKLNDLLKDYIAGRRDNVTDGYEREPLFTTPSGRVSRNRLYKDTVAFSRPCVYANHCPDGRDIETCEYAQKKEKAMSCPENFSLHPIRRGSISKQLARGWPQEKVSERCDVSKAVMDKHYDTRTEHERQQLREQYRDLL